MEEHINQQDEATVKSIGGTLLLARTEAGLSQDDVAKRLNLSKTFVQYIENDEFEKLEQSPVFIRGYVRTYARLVNLDEDAMIALLNTHGIFEKAKPRSTYVSTRMQITARDKKMRLITYAIVLIILLLTFLWWHSRTSEHVAKKMLPPIAAQKTQSPATTPPTSNNTPSDDAVAKIKSQLKTDNGNT